MYFIGIDPGRQGELCLLDSTTNHPMFMSLNPDKHSVRNIINTIKYTLHPTYNCMIALEHVHSLGGMSAKSNFTFGGMFWRARTILDFFGMPYELVAPKVWQQAVGVPAKKDRDPGDNLKKIIASMAKDLFPSASLYGPRGGLLDGRSDALMIAHYLQVKHGDEYGKLQTNEASRSETISSK